MYLSSLHNLNKVHNNDAEDICFKSKAIYNSTLFYMKKYYERYKRTLSWEQLIKWARKRNKDWVRYLPERVTTHIIKSAFLMMKSFFIKIKKIN